MGDLFWHLGRTFARDKVEVVMKMTQAAFIDSLVDRLDIKYDTQTPASIEFDLGPKRAVGLTSRQ